MCNAQASSVTTCSNVSVSSSRMRACVNARAHPLRPNSSLSSVVVIESAVSQLSLNSSCFLV